MAKLGHLDDIRFVAAMNDNVCDHLILIKENER